MQNILLLCSKHFLIRRKISKGKSFLELAMKNLFFQVHLAFKQYCCHLKQRPLHFGDKNKKAILRKIRGYNRKIKAGDIIHHTYATSVSEIQNWKS